MGRVNTRRRADALAFTQDKRGFQPYKARDRPVSDLLPKVGQMTPQGIECHGKGIAVAFLLNFGGSKVKRDKGGMPGEPGNRQKRRQAKAFRRLRRCYGFGEVLRNVCRSKGYERYPNAFSVIRKVLPEEKRPDSGFPNFLKAL